MVELEPTDQSVRRAMRESRKQLADSVAVVVKRDTQRIREAQLEVVEPLLLLSQSRARVRQLQTQIQIVEARR